MDGIDSLDWKNLAACDRVTFRGHDMCAHDAALHLRAEKQFGATVAITQGGYNPGGVAASAGAHDRGGALDWSVTGMSQRKKHKWDHAVKDAGSCAWHRDYIPNLWPEHQHGITRGCRKLSPVAANQIPAFDAERNGLVSNLLDPSYRPQPKAELDYAAFRDNYLRRQRLERINDRLGHLTRQLKGLRRQILAARDKKQELKGSH